jgi:hypothetical protein
MHPTIQNTDPEKTNWRVELDRAWRSPVMRRAFETECHVAPLAQTDTGLAEQAS